MIKTGTIPPKEIIPGKIYDFELTNSNYIIKAGYKYLKLEKHGGTVKVNKMELVNKIEYFTSKGKQRKIEIKEGKVSVKVKY